MPTSYAHSYLAKQAAIHTDKQPITSKKKINKNIGKATGYGHRRLRSPFNAPRTRRKDKDLNSNK